MSTPLAQYTFTWDDLLSALSGRMRAIDHANGVTFNIPAGKEKTDKQFTHRIRATDAGVDVTVFDAAPEPVLRIPLRKKITLTRDGSG